MHDYKHKLFVYFFFFVKHRNLLRTAFEITVIKYDFILIEYKNKGNEA